MADYKFPQHSAGGRPERIGNIVAQLLARCQVAGVQAARRWERVWQEAVGADLAKFSRPGKLSRGRLQVIVSSSAVLQELALRKEELLAKIRRMMPEAEVADLQFRIGTF